MKGRFGSVTLHPIRQRDVASNPPIEAFSLEENTCNGVSLPCCNLAIILGKEMKVICLQVRQSERKAFSRGEGGTLPVMAFNFI